jgi:hypothetical protein
VNSGDVCLLSLASGRKTPGSVEPAEEAQVRQLSAAPEVFVAAVGGAQASAPPGPATTIDNLSGLARPAVLDFSSAQCYYAARIVA